MKILLADGLMDEKEELFLQKKTGGVGGWGISGWLTCSG
jgi:hypothetical protein